MFAWFQYFVFLLTRIRNTITTCSSLEDQQNQPTDDLWVAINNKNWALVERLIKNGADIYTNKYNQHDHGVSILNKVISNNQWQLAEYLIDRTQINYINIYSSFNDNHPLWNLARKNQWGLAKRFLLQATKENIMPQADSSIGNFVIWSAAKAQEWDWIEELAERFAYVNFTENIRGFTKESALSVCMFHRKWEVIAALLKQSSTDNKIKIIQELAKLTDIEPMAMDLIIKNIFCIPELQIEQLECAASKIIDVAENKINEFYAKVDGYVRCHEIHGKFTEENTKSYREKMTGKFYREVYLLMEKFAELSPPGIGKLNFREFPKLFENPSHFHSDRKSFYITMKKSLEEIYYILANDFISEAQTKKVLADLSRQLVVCGPGIFNSIIDIRQNLTTGNLNYWLAKYRQKIILDAAAEFIIEIRDQFAFPEQMSIHVDALFLMEAAKLKLEPLGGHLQLKYGDIFAGGIVQTSLVHKKINDCFKEKYRIAKIIAAIKCEFIEKVTDLKLANNVAIDTQWIQYSDYKKIDDQLVKIAKMYGLTDSDNELYRGLIDFSEDCSGLAIRNEVIDFYVLQTLDNSKIKSIKINQNKSLIYFLGYGSLLYWEQYHNNKIVPCTNKSKSLEYIFDKTNELTALVEYLKIVLYPNIHKKDFIEILMNNFNANGVFNAQKLFTQIKTLTQDTPGSTPYSSYYRVSRA